MNRYIITYPDTLFEVKVICEMISESNDGSVCFYNKNHEYTSLHSNFWILIAKSNPDCIVYRIEENINKDEQTTTK